MAAQKTVQTTQTEKKCSTGANTWAVLRVKSNEYDKAVKCVCEMVSHALWLNIWKPNTISGAWSTCRRTCRIHCLSISAADNAILCVRATDAVVRYPEKWVSVRLRYCDHRWGGVHARNYKKSPPLHPHFTLGRSQSQRKWLFTFHARFPLSLVTESHINNINNDESSCLQQLYMKLVKLA